MTSIRGGLKKKVNRHIVSVKPWKQKMIVNYQITTVKLSFNCLQIGYSFFVKREIV